MVNDNPRRADDKGDVILPRDDELRRHVTKHPFVSPPPVQSILRYYLVWVSGRTTSMCLMN